jgi:colanic acid/amylovoran biosynthesis protein
MPQSMGPFDYGKKQKKMDKLLNRYLPYPAIIMPREEEGYRLLTEVYGLNNVKQSYDLVLQNKGLCLNNVVNSAYKNRIPELQSSGNVAIIPNDRNFSYGNHNRYNNLYWNLIKRLRYHKKSVYIIRHSREDLDACKMIYEGLQDKQGVYLLEDDFDCIQFNGLVQQMDYIIGSRYHGIVHAFKNAVPAIVLGWATKYKVLLSMFDQDRFLFDVRGNIDEEALLNAIDDMEECWQDEKRTIGARLGAYQTENCFAYIREYFN